MREEGIDDEKIQRVVEVVNQFDPFEKAKEQLEKESQRITFINSTFPNVKPETVLLSPKNGPEKHSYQYVPLRASLKLLLEDKSFLKQKCSDPYHHQEGLIQDVRDGECYRSSPYFSQHPEAVGIILFQDELEIVNPLGAGKTKHKFNCTYMSTLDIQPALRSKTQSIQLVSIVPSKHWKKYGNKECNRRLVEDLHLLETEGVAVSVPTDKIVKAGLLYIVGDNLGQHTIAEMSQNFSSGQICRWCKITHKNVCKDGLSYSQCQEGFSPEEWTVESYDENAKKAEDGDGGEDTFGIKGTCVFNQLGAFHCALQLPPCIGHDFYEGVFSYDLQFYLEFLINKEKLLTQEQFNKRIKDALLSSRDSNNRPREFKTRKKNSKYEGNAGSLRVLGRIITTLLSDVLEESQVGALIVKLRDVSEIITAPKLTKYEIDNILHFTVMEYLDLRTEAIENLGMGTMKPKHHFMSHYSKLYMMHGPLIHLWAMRMESKHQYMKNCVRTSKNFINPSKTCASRHQMAQITYAYTGLFPPKFDVPHEAASISELKVMKNDVRDEFVRNLSIGEDALLPTNVTVFGTKYEAGMVLVLDKRSFGELTVGLLKVIAYWKEQVYFGCTVFEAVQSKLGFYVTSKKIKNLEVVNHSKLADHHPLHRIGTAERFSFSLHHFVSQPEPELAGQDHSACHLVSHPQGRQGVSHPEVAGQGQAVCHLGCHPEGGQGESHPGAALPDL